MVKKHRDSLELIHNILSVIKEDSKKTIISKLQSLTNMSNTTLVKKLNPLIKSGLIIRTEKDVNKFKASHKRLEVTYALTPNGFELLNQLEEFNVKFNWSGMLYG